MTNNTPVDDNCSNLILDIQAAMGENACPTPQVMREIFKKYYPERKFAFNHTAKTLEEQCGLGVEAGIELTNQLNMINNRLRADQPRSAFVETVAEELTPIELAFLVEHLHNRLTEALKMSAQSIMGMFGPRRGSDDETENAPWK